MNSDSVFNVFNSMINKRLVKVQPIYHDWDYKRDEPKSLILTFEDNQSVEVSAIAWAEAEYELTIK